MIKDIMDNIISERKSKNIEDDYGLFEPVHGSAPDIAGKGIANPCSMILTIAMMLDYLKEYEISNKINKAVENVVSAGKTLTPDLGGNSTTSELAKSIVDEILEGDY